MVRGVSGGKRKRTTTGEMAFGSKYVMMMDKISTGLDSAATFNIISTQRSIARRFRKTVVMSLLQPSPEVFGLFDDVILMNEGQIMYNGPCDEVLSYFNRLGLKCPPHRDTADFLLDLGTFNQSQYESAVHHGLTIPQTPDEFAETFKQSLFYRRVLEDLEGPICIGACNNPSDHPEFHQNNWNSTKLLMKRQIQIMRRESSALIGRLVMNIVMGLLYATVFYQFNDSDAQLAMGIIFESVLTLSLAQSAQIPTIMAEREVFYKQRGANFFQTGAYVLSSSICQMPQIILETVVFGSIVYWMCGFVSTLGSFIFFLTMLCLTNIAFAAFFFFLGSVAPDLNIANPISSVTVLFFVLFAGFTVTKGQIPDYLVWLYWINPMGWGVRALAVNQYSDEHFNRYSLNSFEVPTEKYWLWYGMIYMGAAYVLFMFLSFIALEYHRFERPENVPLKLTNLDDATGNYTLSQTPRHPPTEYEEVITVGHSVEKQFVPVTVAFKNLWYSVPDPQDPKKTIDLLKGISGYALPGTITALMGSSGAGKTTLMDVIAGRKTKGKIEGEILLNGHPATDLAIRRSTGYCEQMDIHSASSTIREALTFSAFLRQGADVPASTKYESVNECLDLLDLHPIADQIIRSSSVEQMKRLTIGVEMAAQPSQHNRSINGVMKLPDNYNPATWMLEVIGAGVSSNNGTNVVTDFAEIFHSYSGINSGMGMMYLSMGFLGIASFNGIIPAAAEERAVFYRERAAQTYNAFWYFFASSVVEIPFVIVSVLLFMGPFFPMVGFTGAGIFFAVSSVLILHVLLQAYIGELLVFSMPNMEIAEIVGMQISLTSFLFMGYSPPASSLPTGWKWLYHIVPLKYSLAAQSAIVFGDCPSDGDSIGCKQITNLPPTLPVGITVKKYLESKFLIKYSEIWTNCAALIGFILLMRILTLVSMRFINHQKR
ncbi:ATP-binding cassette (ABC) Superfamily [Phytophthora palmivora]|uniref:ATP-binding cassette (ABC) Superfamily n=1 Tax=Phytophthora palmivora TaxID=4796 RepID=A0A2P4XNG9_9STRA|nr:ATP-binding cassette (ABC) Superfamily [Phytophthora palmivora]